MPEPTPTAVDSGFGVDPQERHILCVPLSCYNAAVQRFRVDSSCREQVHEQLPTGNAWKR